MTKHADRIISEAMSILGSRTSERKAASSRANGRRGGRPRILPHRERCQGILRDGHQCASMSLPNERYCRRHEGQHNA